MVEEGTGWAVDLYLVVDAKSIYAAVAAKLVKVPAEASLFTLQVTT